MKIARNSIMILIALGLSAGGICSAASTRDSMQNRSVASANRNGADNAGMIYKAGGEVNFPHDFMLEISLKDGQIEKHAACFRADSRKPPITLCARVVKDQNERIGDDPSQEFVIYQDGRWTEAAKELDARGKLLAEVVLEHEKDHVARAANQSYTLLRVTPEELGEKLGAEPSFALKYAWAKLMFASEGAAEYASEKFLDRKIGRDDARAMAISIKNDNLDDSGRLMSRESVMYTSLFDAKVLSRLRKERILKADEYPNYPRAREVFKQYGGDKYFDECYKEYERAVIEFLGEQALEMHMFMGYTGTVRLCNGVDKMSMATLLPSDIADSGMREPSSDLMAVYTAKVVWEYKLARALSMVKDRKTAERYGKLIKEASSMLQLTNQEMCDTLQKVDQTGMSGVEEFAEYFAGNLSVAGKIKGELGKQVVRMQRLGVIDNAQLRKILGVAEDRRAEEILIRAMFDVDDDED